MLTQQQIGNIASYCQIMGVEYYDVQLELVDHIADIIEQLQKENPGLDFEDALRMATQQFAPLEFLKIAKNKERQLSTRFKRLWLKEFLAYFTFPKIMVTLLFVVLVVFIDSLKILDNLSIKQADVPYSICVYIFIFLRQNVTISRQRRIKHIIDRVTLPLLVYKILLTRNKIMNMGPFICITIIGFSSSLFIKNEGNETLRNHILLYSFPLFLIICLAWKNVFREQTKLMQKQYAAAFEN